MFDLVLAKLEAKMGNENKDLGFSFRAGTSSVHSRFYRQALIVIVGCQNIVRCCNANGGRREA
jgi:hypothetical protein